ncbi:MAG: hypothetical protein NVSMB20_06810 [Bradyrhizobium sp.]
MTQLLGKNAISPGVTRRLVYHIGGYDPITPPDDSHLRFLRELKRFERTWSVSASVASPVISPQQMAWTITAKGPNWQVENQFHLVRWDDIIQSGSRAPLWRRLPLGLLAFLDFVLGGALRGYFRTNWHYAVFFLYPFVLFGVFLAVAVAVGILAGRANAWTGAIAGLTAVAALLAGPWRWLHLAPLFDDWIFSRDYIRSGSSILGDRLGRIAEQIVEAAREQTVDEILVVGHSLGAVLAIDLIDKIVARQPALGVGRPRLALITIGSSILKIGLHRGARDFRAAVARVAAAPGVFWGDYQARVDIMNFYGTHPTAEMALAAGAGPVVRLVEIGRMLEHAIYRKMRLRFFRLHCQFISGNDRRAEYDYFMLVCGPLTAEYQTRNLDGAQGAIGQDGALVDRLHEGVC